MAINNSYEFQNVQRDFNEAFEALRANSPTFLSQVRVGPAATATKIEWLNENLTPTATSITALATDGDGTTFDVNSTAGFKAGDIVGFRSSTGQARSELAKITSITDGNTLVIERDFGSTAGVTLATGNVIYLVNRPLQEGTDALAYDGAEASVDYNFTQIEDYTAKVSKTAQLIGQYGVENLLNEQVERGMLHLLRRVNQTVIDGVRTQRGASNPGTCAGFRRMIAATNVGGALTATAFNNAFETLFDNGVVSNQLVIVAPENQARKISAFNTATSNQVVQVPYGTNTTGGFVSTFIGDLPTGGFQARILVEPNMPKDQVAILDMNRIALRYLRTMQDMDATPVGGDYWQRRLLVEFSLEVRDADKAHTLLTGLTV